MMLASRFDRGERRMWLRFGGCETLDSYGHWPSDDVYDHVPERHWRFLEKELRNWYETETHLFAHANVDPRLPLEKQDSTVLLWKRLDQPIKHESGKVLICGHTRQDSGYPLDLGSTVCIDTSVYMENGWLTCLDVDSRQFWQANQCGETRSGMLDNLTAK
jgi:serine/threonine protein phosphatase 1